MTLYHFCAAHMVRSIMQEGLTMGKFPVLSDKGWSFIEPCQWLSAEPDARKQSWATSYLINYDRTAYRLTVNIPRSYLKKLKKATDFVKTLSEESRGLVEGWDGSEKWYIFKGKIPSAWIVGCKKMKGGGMS